MLHSYLPIVIFAGIAVVFIGVTFFASTFLAPRRRTMAKTAPYECGIVPENDTQQRFGVKFYLLAIAFIVLDIEIIFLYPFATVFVDRLIDGERFVGLGSAGLGVMGIFLLVLLVPFAYLLSSGALNFGPGTPKTSSLLKPIIRSQGFTAEIKSSSPSSQRNMEVSVVDLSETSAASEETTGSKRPAAGRGREASSEGTASETSESQEEGEA